MNREFAVIGLGRFGGSICRELSRRGMKVLAIDTDEQRINEFKDIASHSVIADSTDELALTQIGIKHVDHVIVAIGENIQASILTTVILSELGVKQITVKAQNDYHEKILKKIGAHHVVHPERDMGVKLANHLISSNILDFLELSKDHSIVEVKASEKMVGKTLIDLNIRAKFGCNVVAIKSEDSMRVSPAAQYVIKENDVLVLIGANDQIEKFEKQLIY